MPREPDQLICVAPDHAATIWPHVAHLIERAVMKGNADNTAQSIRESVESGRALLWIVWSGSEIVSAATTELLMMEAVGKMCLITAAAGRDLRKWERFLAQIEMWAKAEGCDVLRFYGRPGWAHFLRKSGYQQPWFVLQKKLR
jgi:hypothetical protein